MEQETQRHLLAQLQLIMQKMFAITDANPLFKMLFMVSELLPQDLNANVLI